MLRPKKQAPAYKASPDGQLPQAVPALDYNFPAPTRGWVLNENLATVQPGGARILDNWICKQSSVRVRGGCLKYATLSGAVRSLFSYNVGSEKFFAATNSGVFDITAPIDATTVLTADVSGQSSGIYSTVHFGTAGGDFLYAVNGTDAPLLYNGATFTAITGVSTPAITGVTTTLLSQVWAYANRLFFVEGSTMRAWYLPVDSIGGAAQSFSLAGVFNKGGSLLFGAKWSIDAGDGLDDKCVFVSTEGEVAVYEGLTPGSATDWRLAGLYQMPKPLGRNSHTTAGGDLLIATEIGLIPVSASVQNDLAALESKAVSKQIAPYWQQQAGMISGDWNLVKMPQKGVMYVSQPDSAGGTKTALVVSLLTGAWSRCTGWDTRCIGAFGTESYFGAGDASIYLMDTGGADDGVLYTAAYLGQHDAMGAYGKQKTVMQMRGVYASGTPFEPQLTALANFGEDLPAAPNSPPDALGDLWDLGIWDAALWASAPTVVSDAIWSATGVTGITIAPVLQLSFGVSVTPVVELVSIEAQYRVGATVA